jgi:hypothetical protein
VAGSGKTTLANLLAQKHGYRVVNFADPLRDLLRRTNPIIGYRPESHDDAAACLHLDAAPVRWADLERSHGYTGAKAHPRFGRAFREALQGLGEGVRQVLGADAWVEAAFADIRGCERVVFADARYPSEADAVRRAGGLVLRIERHIDGRLVGPVNGHISETALDRYRFDLHLVNDRTPGDLLAMAELVLGVSSSAAGAGVAA